MRIHVVQKGDTLWKIAKKYNVDHEVLTKMNEHLTSPESLKPGMKVKVPTESVPVKKAKGFKALKKEKLPAKLEKPVEKAPVETKKAVPKAEKTEVKIEKKAEPVPFKKEMPEMKPLKKAEEPFKSISILGKEAGGKPRPNHSTGSSPMMQGPSAPSTGWSFHFPPSEFESLSPGAIQQTEAPQQSEMPGSMMQPQMATSGGLGPSFGEPNMNMYPMMMPYGAPGISEPAGLGGASMSPAGYTTGYGSMPMSQAGSGAVPMSPGGYTTGYGGIPISPAGYTTGYGGTSMPPAGYTTGYGGTSMPPAGYTAGSGGPSMSPAGYGTGFGGPQPMQPTAYPPGYGTPEGSMMAPTGYPSQGYPPLGYGAQLSSPESAGGLEQPAMPLPGEYGMTPATSGVGGFQPSTSEPVENGTVGGGYPQTGYPSQYGTGMGVPGVEYMQPGGGYYGSMATMPQSYGPMSTQRSGSDCNCGESFSDYFPQGGIQGYPPQPAAPQTYRPSYWEPSNAGGFYGMAPADAGHREAEEEES